MRRGSFIKKVMLACAPKHPYNTKTHLAQELRSPPIERTGGCPSALIFPTPPRTPYMAHPHPPVLFLNATDFSPCEGDCKEVRPLRPGPKRPPPKIMCLYYRIPIIIFIRAARHGPSREKNGGKQAHR